MSFYEPSYDKLVNGIMSIIICNYVARFWVYTFVTIIIHTVIVMHIFPAPPGQPHSLAVHDVGARVKY